MGRSEFDDDSSCAVTCSDRRVTFRICLSALTDFCNWSLLFVFIATFCACFLIVLTPHGADWTYWAGDWRTVISGSATRVVARRVLISWVFVLILRRRAKARKWSHQWNNLWRGSNYATFQSAFHSQLWRWVVLGLGWPPGPNEGRCHPEVEVDPSSARWPLSHRPAPD